MSCSVLALFSVSMGRDRKEKEEREKRKGKTYRLRPCVPVCPNSSPQSQRCTARHYHNHPPASYDNINYLGGGRGERVEQDEKR